MWALVVIGVLIALYLFGTRTYGYWAARGVPHDMTVPFLGTDAPRYLLQRCVADSAALVYHRYPNHRFVGYYRGTTPELVIRDPDLIQAIIVNDFAYFYSRGLTPEHGLAEPLLQNLFFAEGDLWRLLRQRLTPTFSSGKLRGMFPLVAERARRLQALLDQQLADGDKVLDARDVMARFAIDFIGAVGFGIEAGSLDDDKSEFRKLGTNIFAMTVKRVLVVFAKSVFPNTFKHWKFLGQDIEDEILTLVKRILQQRGYKHSGRNDFLDLLLELKAKGKLVVESLEKPPTADGKAALAELELNDLLMTAQAFMFFAAGFETSSTATSVTLHQLAHNPEAQAKVRADIDRVLAKHNGELSFDSVKEMTYLEWAFLEGMRLFPSAAFLMRRCVRRYTLPGTDVTIDPGVRVVMPMNAIHTDPEYWEEPEKFRPERFAPEEVSARHKFVYLPFGEGPRSCIGGRLGQMQSLCGLAALLARFEVRPAPGTPAKLRSDRKSLVIQNIAGGVPLLFTRRHTATTTA